MSRLRQLQPWLVPYASWLVGAAAHAGARSVRITSVRRSAAEQRRLYERWLQGKSQFPAAPPGQSKHQYGLAWDMITDPPSALHTLGAWWRSVGGRWSESDPIHFEVI